MPHKHRYLETLINAVLITSLTGIATNATAQQDSDSDISSLYKDTSIIPDSHKGLKVVSLGVLPEDSLKEQIGLSGYKMQLREITIEPDGQIGKHDHFKKPGLVWTTKGVVQEGRQDFSIRAYPDTLKEAILEDRHTVHWFRNTTEEPASMVVCDIVPSE